MTSADRAPLALSFRRMEIFCATYEREFLEHSTHPRVVIAMPPPRKTHLEALIEKAPVESKGFFFIEHPPCRASVVLRTYALNPKARDSCHRLKPGLDPQGGQGRGFKSCVSFSFSSP